MTAARRFAPPVLAAVFCLGPLAASAQSAAELRQELDTVAAALDRAVRQVSRAGSFALSGQTTRAYALPGVGAVFVLPTRALPFRRAQNAQDRQAARALADARAKLERSLRVAETPERREQVERSLEAVRQAQVELKRRSRPVAPAAPGAPAKPAAGMPAKPPTKPLPPSAPVAPEHPSPDQGELLIGLPPLHELAAEVEAQMAAQADMMRQMEQASRHVDEALADQIQAELRALHGQADAFRREAERARQEAERSVRSQLAGSLPPVPVAPTAVVVPPPPAPVLAAPPWSFWFEFDDGEEPEDTENVVDGVRDAVVAVLEAQGTRLTRVAAADSVVVAVDFVPHGGSALPRTLVLRVRKRDLDERKAGRLGAEDFRRRVEVTEY